MKAAVPADRILMLVLNDVEKAQKLANNLANRKWLASLAGCGADPAVPTSAPAGSRNNSREVPKAKRQINERGGMADPPAKNMVRAFSPRRAIKNSSSCAPAEDQQVAPISIGRESGRGRKA
jgi:hypothetical protein